MNLRSKIKSEKGNVFTFLLGGIAIVGVLSFGGYQLLSGPLTSASNVSQINIAKNQLVMVSQVLIMDATNQAGGGDCDNDGFIEPRAFRTPTGAAPTNGGYISLEAGTPTLDPWGSEFGYCVWDVGPLSATSSCASGAGRIDGADDPLANPANSSLVFAIVSSGPDKVFETDCNAYVDSSTDQITTAGDDIVKGFTYQQANTASSALWNMKSGANNIAETQKKLEVGSDFALDTTAGSIQASSLNTSGKIIADGGLIVGAQGTVTSCAGSDAGTIRYNSGDQAIDICDGAGNWISTNGSGLGWPLRADDGSAPAPSYSFENATDIGLFYDGTDTLSFKIRSGKEGRLVTGDTNILLDNTQALFSSRSTFNIKNYGSEKIVVGRNGNSDFRLISEGGIKLANTTPACDVMSEGVVKYEPGDKKHFFCDGTDWQDFPPLPVFGCTPDAIAFTDQTGVTPDSFILSNTVTISGLEQACFFVADFEFGGSIVKNSSDTGESFVSIDNGDTVQLRARSHPTTLRPSTATLSGGAGQILADWTTTTAPCAAGSGSQTYTTPGTYSYTPPGSIVGCTFVITVKGAGGGSNHATTTYANAASGGGIQFGWSADGTSADFDILVGGGGDQNGTGGYGGGGNGGTGAVALFGGGGASAIKYDNTLIAVAGGGGGARSGYLSSDTDGNGAPYGSNFNLQGGYIASPTYYAVGGGPNGQGGVGSSVAENGGQGGTSTVGTAQNGGLGTGTGRGTGGTAFPAFSVSGGGGGAGMSSASSRGHGGGGGFGGGGGGGWAAWVGAGGGGYLKTSGSYSALVGYTAVQGGLRGNSSAPKGGDGEVIISWE